MPNFAYSIRDATGSVFGGTSEAENEDILRRRLTEQGFTVVDIKRRETIRDAWIASRSAWTPYDGRSVTGWPVGTFVRGRKVMWNGEVTTPSTGAPVRFA